MSTSQIVKPVHVVNQSTLATGAATAENQEDCIDILESLDGKTTVVNTDSVTVVSSALPTGAATESTLSSLNAKITAVDTGSVVVASSALPSGASTAANQTTANSSLSSIDGKITAVDTGAVVVASSALPSGAATSANQTTANASLSSIDGKITTVNTGAVVIASSALPSGAATAANQATANASLSSIDGKITAVNTGAVVVASSALPSGAATEATLSTLNGKVTAVDTGAVTISTALPAGSNSIGILGANSGVDIGDVTINNAAGASAVNIQDGGNSITVDGTVSIGTALPAGSNSIGILGANSGVDIGDVTINNASGASAVNIQDGGNLITVDGDASTTTFATLSGNTSVRVSRPGEWAITNSPGVNAQATVSRAAVASTRHVCTGFSASLTNTAAVATLVTLHLRDGATGAGTILWTHLLAIPAVTGSCQIFTATGLNIVGSTNTAMTCEFTVAGGANTIETVALSGYDIS